MSRPTIKDLAREAGVSVSTVNRVINGSGVVRQSTREVVLKAAESIRFYGLGSIESAVSHGRETHTLGVLLHQGHRVFYRDLGNALERAAESVSGSNVSLKMTYLDDLSPENIAQHILDMGESCESIGVVAAEHPLVSDAISTVLSRGVPVSALIGPLSARGNVGYIGHDNWKKGRMAAWAFHKLTRRPGKIGILLGNHRYRNQELNESGFRSYFREHNTDFTLLEPVATFESAAVAREVTSDLFRKHPDMCGLFVSGGGITGALGAMREQELPSDFVCVAYELFDATRAGLIDGRLAMTLSYPVESFAREIIQTLIKAKQGGPAAGAHRVHIRFDVHTAENL